jgi:predicted TIM-barrel fold metal-dependent hydrolase
MRFILRGTFDRHRELQLVLGHWGKLLHAVERADSLPRGLECDVAQVLRENVHTSTSGMLTPLLLRYTLDLAAVDRVLLSGDYPFRRPDPESTAAFLDTLPARADQENIDHANAEALFGIEQTQPSAHRGAKHPQPGGCSGRAAERARAVAPGLP